MQITCTCCFARFSLDAAVQDDAARELSAMMAKLDKECSQPLIAYIGLFRSRTRALAWERALRLAQEVMALGTDKAALGAALSETVNSMRDKQAQANWKPLSNHNYLKRVLDSVVARGTGTAISTVAGEQVRRPSSKVGEGIQRLQAGKRVDE